MILAIGEILYDVFPDYRRIGGAPFNVAFHLKNLGKPVGFISRIGRDTDGDEIIKRLKQYEFSVEYIQLDERHCTGKVMVDLDRKGIPSFNILPDVAYDYIEFNPAIESLLDENTRLIYFGTLAQRSEYGFKTIQRILSQRDSSTKCLYDVNLRPGCFTGPVVTASLNQSDVVKLNDEELQVLKRMFAFEKSDSAFIKHLMAKYVIEMLSLTKGKNGSELFAADQHYRIEPNPLDHVVDTVGAGDAYTAILSIGYLSNWPPNRILKQATEFANSICKIKGAIPDEPNFYMDAAAL